MRARRQALVDRADAVLEQACRLRPTLPVARTLPADRPSSSGASRNGRRSSSTAVVARRRRRTPPRRTAATADRRNIASAGRGRSARATNAARRPRGIAGRAARSIWALRQIGPRERERHHVLQLIAEAVRAARLVVAAPRVHRPAAHVLVEQPAVDEHVERVVRRVDFDRAKRAIPVGLDACRRRGSAASTPPCRAINSRACASLVPCPSSSTTRRDCAGREID